MQSLFARLLGFIFSFALLIRPFSSPPKSVSVEIQPTSEVIPTTSIVVAPSPPVTTLLTTGDVMLGRSVRVATEKSGDPMYSFKYIYDLLSSSDITLVNLENPLLDPCPVTTTGMVFCAPTDRAISLAASGIDVANLANNHTMNYGKQGYVSTKDALRKNGILPSDAADLAIIERNGLRFGFLGFDIITSWPDESLVLKNVAGAKQRVDVLVVSFHRGAEYASGPSERERQLLRAVVDAGADLIIGHHPHVVQEVEEYRGVPIVYSLGNFIFDQMWSAETREGVVGQFTFVGKTLSSFTFIPIAIDDIGQPTEAVDTERKARIFRRLGTNYTK